MAALGASIDAKEDLKTAFHSPVFNSTQLAGREVHGPKIHHPNWHPNVQPRQV
jgi:hypothetical protein